MLVRARDAALDLLFPYRCFSCLRKRGGKAPLCDRCEAELGGPQGPVSYGHEPAALLSPEAITGLPGGPKAPERHWVAGGFSMRGPGASLIHALKYEGAGSIAPYVARRMYLAWRRWPRGRFDYLLPVPLDRTRRRLRGYNQSLLLAEELTRLTGIPTAEGLLVRTRATAAQAGLSAELRPANVMGAFAARSPKALKGRRVLLVDDVATTGSTLTACTVAILGSAPAEVAALVGAIS